MKFESEADLRNKITLTTTRELSQPKGEFEVDGYTIQARLLLQVSQFLSDQELYNYRVSTEPLMHQVGVDLTGLLLSTVITKELYTELTRLREVEARCYKCRECKPPWRSDGSAFRRI